MDDHETGFPISCSSNQTEPEHKNNAFVQNTESYPAGIIPIFLG